MDVTNMYVVIDFHFFYILQFLTPKNDVSVQLLRNRYACLKL